MLVNCYKAIAVDIVLNGLISSFRTRRSGARDVGFICLRTHGLLVTGCVVTRVACGGRALKILFSQYAIARQSAGSV